MADIHNSELYNLTGILPTDACVVIVRTEWNAAVVDRLEQGCHKVFSELGIQNIVVLKVPGAVEIPFLIKHYSDNVQGAGRADAFIALGSVLRGDTPHFDYVCQSVTQGITMLNIQLPVPVIFGVLTINTAMQAEERLGGSHGHKGEEAAITAIKMIQLQRSLKPAATGR